MVALTNLLNRSIGVAVKADVGGVAPLEGAEGGVADGHLGPVGSAPGDRVGKTKDQTPSEIDQATKMQCKGYILTNQFNNLKFCPPWTRG